MLSRSKRQTSDKFHKKALRLAVAGGVVFWATTIATSLLPIAAEYRAHFTNWKLQTVWVASLFMGMIIGCCVSYSLLRFIEKNPTRNPIQKSTIMSFIALVIAIILIDVPQSFLLPGSRDALYFFLIGVMFNAARFLVLGIVIGYLYKKLYGSASAHSVGIGLPGVVRVSLGIENRPEDVDTLVAVLDKIARQSQARVGSRGAAKPTATPGLPQAEMDEFIRTAVQRVYNLPT